MAAGAAKAVIEIEMTEGGVEVVDPHQANHTSAEPDAFGIARRAADDLGGFGEATYPFTDSWRLTAGVRYDYTYVQTNEVYTAVNPPLPPGVGITSTTNMAAWCTRTAKRSRPARNAAKTESKFQHGLIRSR